jgi:hypothetical protein
MKKMAFGVLLNVVVLFFLCSAAPQHDEASKYVSQQIVSLLSFTLIEVILVVLFAINGFVKTSKIIQGEQTQRLNIDGLKKFTGKNYKDILTENGLDEYIDIFMENNLTDINIISTLGESDFEKMGIKIMDDRKKIINIFSISKGQINNRWVPGMWKAVLVCNIIGLNWISRFITGHIGTGIFVFVLDIFFVRFFINISNNNISIALMPQLILAGIIWIVDLVTIGTGKWRWGDKLLKYN